MPEQTERAAHVAALQTELAYLTRQPKPDADRVRQVEAQLDAFADKPAKRTRETAAKTAKRAPEKG